MTESFLFFAWKFRLFSNPDFKTLSGESLSIIKTGELNPDAGPDFFNARVKIGDTLWAGNIEIHIRTSDWLRHGHQHNKAYSNIILHVVFESDMQIQGSNIPVLELREYLEMWLVNPHWRG